MVKYENLLLLASSLFLIFSLTVSVDGLSPLPQKAKATSSDAPQLGGGCYVCEYDPEDPCANAAEGQTGAANCDGDRPASDCSLSGEECEGGEDPPPEEEG